MKAMYLKTMIDSGEPLTYCGITARLPLWQAAGMKIVPWMGEEFELSAQGSCGDRSDYGPSDGDLLEASLVSRSTGEAALVWLISERRRQAEERSRVRAAYVAADAQKKAGDGAIHAARIHRQAEELRCLASGVDARRINARLE